MSLCAELYPKQVALTNFCARRSNFLTDQPALIVVSASGQENTGQENGNSYIFLSCIFLSAGSDGRNDDQGPSNSGYV